MMSASTEQSEKPGILVFPGGMEGALRFARRSLAARRRVVGASSLAYDPASGQYPAWVHLPQVTQDAFDQELRRILADEHIDEVFTPHPVIWNYLERRLAEIAPGVRLTHESIEQVVAEYSDAIAEVDVLGGGAWDLAGPAPISPPLLPVEGCSLLHFAGGIPGHCGNEKIWALAEVARRCPEGDLVEIGSAWGKSAYVLAWLARRHGLGKLLCVDPWSAAHRHQNDDGGRVNDWAERMDFDAALKVFEINLAGFGGGAVNYLRIPSHAGARVYAHRATVSTPVFGSTRYEGRIALLHIDGNHDYDQVRRDAVMWAPMVAPGGWIVFDDYTWAFGDGPKRVGDAFLYENAARIDAAFVAGTALFVRLASEASL